MDFKSLLHKRHLKQIDLAKKLKIDPSRISLFINGIRPFPIKYHNKVAEIFEIPLEQLKKEMKRTTNG